MPIHFIRIAQGRYDLGTIAEDELLQMQLSWLNTETARKEAEMNLRDREIRLKIISWIQ